MRLPSEETMPDDIPLAKLTVQCTLIIVTGDEDPDEDPACGACGACGERESDATHQECLKETPCGGGGYVS